MKNITLSLDDTAYREARIKAAEHGVSVSALVRELIDGFDASERESRAVAGMRASEFARREHAEQRLRDVVRGFDGGLRARPLTKID